MSSIIDFHSHILPRVDDGSASVGESIEMLRIEAAQGISQVIATPHFYARYDTPERFLQKRNESAQKLQEELSRYPELPKVCLGAEVYFFRGMSNSDAILDLTISEKRSILIEMPGVSWTESMYRELELIYTRFGLTPIIAHIDRYIKPFRARQILNSLAELPVRVQANAEFFLNKSTCGLALRTLKKDQIHLLGSDCHDLSDRKPNLGEAIDLIRKRSGDEVLHRIEKYQKESLGV